MTTPAPIALFVYNRPLHTRRTVEALRANEGASRASLFVFCDGPARPDAAQAVDEVRAFARQIRGFRSVEVVESDVNRGLANSIIGGVTRLCADYGRAIVVEDDLLTSPFFLRYLNDGLNTFADDDRVASIHAYLPPVRPAPGGNFFLRGADCWGWATWERAWRHFDPDAARLLERLSVDPHRRTFDYFGTMPHTSMLRGFLARRNNSWAIRWHASMFLSDRLTLHPARTLVNNIGLDGSGTHCSDNDDMNTPIAEGPLPVERIPLEHSERMWRAFRNQYVRQSLRRVARKILP